MGEIKPWFWDEQWEITIPMTLKVSLNQNFTKKMVEKNKYKKVKLHQKNR